MTVLLEVITYKDFYQKEEESRSNYIKSGLGNVEKYLSSVKVK